MSQPAHAVGASSSPAGVWHGLLRPDVELDPAFCAALERTHARAERLTFGDRVHCPFPAAVLPDD